MNYWLTQLFNGFSYGALIFLLAMGLSLIFGVMQVINVTHGTYFLVGTYIGLSILTWTGNFYLAILGGGLVIALVGIFIERFFLRRLRGNDLGQVLITFGFVLLLQDAILLIWGPDPKLMGEPKSISFTAHIGSFTFPSYRLFVIVVAAAVAAGLWLFENKTKFGSAVRAAVDDVEMASGMGVNVPLVFTVVFGLGSFLAGLGGVLSGPWLGLQYGLDLEILPYAFVVVIVGGMGSLKGAILASLLVGLVDNFGKGFFPDLAYFTLFLPMAVILAVRPQGLFGRTL
ncbi:MAG: ABC transporter permease [Candidatus Tectomicrobia bacterium RIFCSPLOWO2_12_FULL_69_37]|nr:MAG: ABC transporter permease [Candidatus Tectomicrobia bacterium RIFCSPLOWO2_02_FULL_70_19]OGL62939.1 MAG: ABC transporter permease [Candidatus Tectomicrobia bacterium RIFCSPLOWO2_12_FULL_69_37]